MATLTDLPYSEAQRARLRAFIMALPERGARGAWHAGDLAWGLFLLSIRFDLAENVRIWEDAQGQVAGFAWYEPPHAFLLMQARPGATCPAVSEAMLAWGRARHAATARTWTEGPYPRLSVSAFETDVDHQAWLEARGFVSGGRSMVLFRRPLAGELPAPQLPAGFTVRAIAGDHEVGQRSAAHREAFQSARVTDEQYHRLRGLPEYQADLDLVAVAADGTVAAFCLVWLDPVNRVGMFEPVGTRPAFQRQGLAQAVLAEGLRRMRAQGMAHGFVCTNHSNAAAQKTYQALGFNILTYDLDYSSA